MSNRPTPTARRKLTGVHPERINKNEAKFGKVESAKPPKYLDKIAAEEFNRVLPELTANGLLNRANLQMFASYCGMFSSMVRALEHVRAHGLYIEISVFDKKTGHKTGTQEILNPSVKVARESALAAKNIAVEFGLTPAAATKVAASLSEKEKPEEEDFAEFVSGAPSKKGAKEKDADPLVQ
jgi:P27 family predicted phage terminase small subunit